MAVKAIPDNYPRVTPYLIVKDVAKQLDFLTKVFDANVKEKMTLADGTINHAEVEIGDSVIMMGKPSNEYPPNSSMIYVYVEDTDKTFKRALDEGAKSLMDPADQFYGDRNAGVVDTNGNSWWIASHIEDVSPEEMKRRNKKK